jgi:hypothetical protein
MPTFGTLEPVELRACWPDEARDLTPWVASDKGLKLLGAALGIDLACENCEVAVGPFNADILARDLTSNALVVIENQLERTNHDHFGKTLTYASVLGATTIVWIARSFTEEHRKALEWLNELTKGDLLFYGVELHVWRIGDSAPAPRFEVVCAPNETVQEAARLREATESPTRQLQLEFWTFVKERLQKSGEFSSLKSPRGQYWFDIALGRTHVTLSLVANTWDKWVGVRIYLRHQVAAAVLEALAPQRDQIEREVGGELEWNPFPDKLDKVIRLSRPGDIADRSRWPELADWLTARAVALKRAFGPRILALDLSGSSSEAAV